MNTAFLFIPFGNKLTFVAQTVICINANFHYKNNFLLLVYNVLCKFPLDRGHILGKMVFFKAIHTVFPFNRLEQYSFQTVFLPRDTPSTNNN